MYQIRTSSFLGNFWKSIDFAFEVKFANVTHLQNTADCNSYICPMFRIPERYCERYCPTVIKNYAKVNYLNALKFSQNSRNWQ